MEKRFAAVVDTADGDHEGYVWGSGTTESSAIADAVREVYEIVPVEHLGDVEPGLHDCTVYTDPVWEDCDDGERIISHGGRRDGFVWLTPSDEASP